VASERAIGVVEHLAPAGHDAQQIERVSPPASLHDETIDIRARRQPTVGMQEPEILEQHGERETGALENPRALKRGLVETQML
jgi:hypothetical protein